MIRRVRPAVGTQARLVLLTFAAGATDAATFLRLGHVFSSVITGNLVLLGAAAGLRNASLALHGGLALAGYAAGVALGAPLAEAAPDDRNTWPTAVTRTLTVEALVLAGFALGWELTGGHPRQAASVVVAVVGAAAMGMQSAAVRKLGQVSTTYLTSTLTGAVSALALRQRPDGLGRSLVLLGTMAVGAAVSAVLVEQAARAMPACQLLPLAIVIAATAGDGKRRTGWA